MEDILLIKYFKGETTASEKKSVLNWIDESETNKEYYLNLRKVWDLFLITGEYSKEPNDAVYNLLRAHIQLEDTVPLKMHSSKTGRLRHIILRMIQVAAIVAITIFATSRFLNTKEIKQSTAKTIVQAPIGSRAKIILPDNSTVWMNSGSSILYSTDFSSTNRAVFLDGEAQFEVKSDNNNKFLVHTTTHTVLVTGTKFNIFAYKASNSFEVALYNGSVILENNAQSSGKLEIKPLQKYHYNKETGKGDLSTSIDPEDTNSWLTGKYVFNRIKFGDMIDKLSSYYNKPIVIINPKIKNIEYTGKFEENESLEHILNVIKKTNNIKYETMKDKIIIY